jgi:hypothetical protein
MGIFNVNMPLLYGEGRKAFQRLQEEIAKTTEDQTLLLFDDLPKREFQVKDNFQSERSLFACHVGDFCADYVPGSSFVPESRQRLMTCSSLRFELVVLLCFGVFTLGCLATERWLALLHCSPRHDSLTRPGIILDSINPERMHFTRPRGFGYPFEFKPEGGLVATNSCHDAISK